MSITAGSLNYLLPIIERVIRFPGKLLVIVAGSITTLSLIAGWFAGRESNTFLAWWPFMVSVLFACAVGVFAVLRFRLARAVDSVIDTFTQTTAGATEVSIINPDGSPVDSTPYSFDDEIIRIEAQQRLMSAQAEAAHKRKVMFPRIEAAQRAAIASAGGIENAPYLRDDLRITLLSALASFAAIPVCFFTFVVGLIISL
ncbi:hypothetical protein [Arcanobacterium buesumense]|uniref:Uncharacterized protein n=1 Tax=Arcanobacterium buesumense TaxID=2722751 RepID=A0A6H2EKS9_9ACTO|nr:hypothetical protein [Arcanobacterium buesumense]QJC21890.1 hypothetical protein HC352_04820 [Arcanobacterium buesumense]